MAGGIQAHGGSTTAYLYDGMGRLTAARYAMLGAPSDPFYRGDHSASYGYDLNSNIVLLVRKGQRDRLGDGEEILFNGFGTIDSLAVSLEGNRLLKVTDAAEEVVYGDAFDFHDGADEDVEYEYDGNGNMTADLNRGIKEIEYDLNNRPVSVTFSTRPAEQRTKYLRDASGRKLRTTYQTSRFLSLGPGDLWHVDSLELNPGIWDHIETGVLRPLSSPGIGGAVERRDGDEVQPAENLLWSTNFIRDYCGDIIYKDGEVERILTDNGYAIPDSAGGYDYYYYVKDWQGNVRAVIDEANRRMELNSYYPYGMPMSSTASVQPYKYGGKELDRTNGLDMYDFGARWYDMLVPHFITIDPLAEKYPSISPYVYCAGNPIRYIDPDGKEVRIYLDDTNYVIYKDQELYTSEGKLYNGFNQFAVNVMKDLISLEGVDTQLYDRILQLIDSPNIHNIKESKKYNQTRSSRSKKEQGIPTGSTVEYNPYKEETVNGDKRPPVIGLAHELLSHSWDADNGSMNSNVLEEGIRMDEIDAINVENKVRKSLNLPIRTKYKGIDIRKYLNMEGYEADDID